MRAAPSGFYYPLCIWEHLYRSTDSYQTLQDGPRLSKTSLPIWSARACLAPLRHRRATSRLISSMAREMNASSSSLKSERPEG